MEEAKMLIKLIVVDSNHFIRYRCKIRHFLDSQTSEYISTIVLDVNEKLSIREVLDVLTGLGTFTSTSSFYTQSFQLVKMNELKMSMVVCNFFLFTYSSIQWLLSGGVRSFLTQHNVCWKMGQMHLSVVD